MNWFKKWREAKRKEQAAREFDAGFLSACKAVLLEGKYPHSDYIFVYDENYPSLNFEDGARLAVSELRKLKEKNSER